MNTYIYYLFIWDGILLKSENTPPQRAGGISESKKKFLQKKFLRQKENYSKIAWWLIQIYRVGESGTKGWFSTMRCWKATDFRGKMNIKLMMMMIKIYFTAQNHQDENKQILKTKYK